ncbi:hypothetical protein ACIOHE_30535 [Streptomyces sp. NPDC087851]|uniref:hypothetical protein n=1 Tax=Streptomyces sp. NPDC087851 TaxID=3365810 RepID=UPI00382F8BB5
MSGEHESDAQGRLSEIVAVVVEVAAEAGESGTYTGEMARTLTAVAVKVGARIAVEAEVRGFTGGWQEAVALVGGTGVPAARTETAGPGEPGGAGAPAGPSDPAELAPAEGPEEPYGPRVF